MRRTSLAVILLLTACQRGDTPSSTDGTGTVGSSTSGLERAAIESGVIMDAARVSPVGLYQRNHEAGRDVLCIIPAKSGGLRFGAEAIFGEEESCGGEGSARRAGDKVILSFSGRGRCIIVARYDGDQIAFPGVMDMTCTKLCEGHASLEGVSFPRITNDAASALRARDRAGKLLCNSD